MPLMRHREGARVSVKAHSTRGECGREPAQPSHRPSAPDRARTDAGAQWPPGAAPAPPPPLSWARHLPRSAAVTAGVAMGVKGTGRICDLPWVSHTQPQCPSLQHGETPECTDFWELRAKVGENLIQGLAESRCEPVMFELHRRELHLSTMPRKSPSNTIFRLFNHPASHHAATHATSTPHSLARLSVRPPPTICPPTHHPTTHPRSTQDHPPYHPSARPLAPVSVRPSVHSCTQPALTE